ncbi:MAG: signal recognition particle-docking protein FtsY [Oscillospiraceae bacterium]|nr:signal recognition particle-docking protein FtsY [Oscillospiraceae bacterium]
MGFFSKIKEGLQKTRDAMMQRFQAIINSFTKIDEELFEQLEETMIMSDMGVETSVEICDRLRKLVKERGVKDPAKIMDLIEEVISDMLGEETELDLSTKPSVIMVIGVNGAGKTTTIGKLCHQFKNDGKKVLVAAADTFRAAAIDQLEVWTQRAGVDIVKHAEGSDPAAVVFNAITAAVARECDVLIIDTAGRLHNKKNLMNELAKINRILEQKAEGCSVETLLVLDATTGQNAVSQAKLFNEVAKITGIVLTKLDGTAKGGIIVSIKNELGIPVKLVGVGEKIEDLQRFNNSDFIKALFDHSDDVKIDEKKETPAEEESAPEIEPEETPAEEESAPEIEPEEIPAEEESAPEIEPEEVPAEEESAPEIEPEEIPAEEESAPEIEPEEIPAEEESAPESESEETPAEEEKKKPFSWLFMEIGPKKKNKDNDEKDTKKRKTLFSSKKKGE